jgi:hypothetical protein
VNSQDSTGNQRSRSRRPPGRQLFFPVRPEQRLEGNGKKYFLHLLTPEQLQQHGMNHRKAQLVIEAYPVLVLSNAWLEELFCPQCGGFRCYHITKHDSVQHTVRWAPHELWQQVAHIDPLHPDRTVSDFIRQGQLEVSLRASPPAASTPAA